MIPRFVRLAFALAVLVTPPLGAQGENPEDFARHVFAPELVMKHQQRIGLRADQRKAITDAIQQLQARVVELQWRMQEETQKMSELLEPSTVNEQEVLAQVDRMLAIERDVKRAHMALLVRIKNTLTPEQQATLRSLR